MSKGLEALQEMRDEAVSSICRYVPRQAYEEVTRYFDKRKSIIEKELKALELIQVKQIDVLYIAMFPDSLEKYNKHVSFIGNNVWCLTQEEFDLLKEVLL